MAYTDDDVPFQGHSGTSREVAERLTNVVTRRLAVLNAIREHGGLTDEEIQRVLSMPSSTQRPRRVELVSMGFIIDSGMTRQTRARRSAVVWRAMTKDELEASPPIELPREKPGKSKMGDMMERCWSCEQRAQTLTIACKSCHLRYNVCTTRSCWSAVHMDMAAHFAVPGPRRCAGDHEQASTPMPAADDEEFDEGQATPVEIPHSKKE